MAAERGRAALHDSAGGLTHMGGQEMGVFVSRKRVLEDRLQGDGAHRRRSEGGDLCARVPYGMGQRIRA